MYPNKDQGTRSSSCSIGDFQVWQEDKEDEVFRVFVLLAWKILDFNYQIEDKFVSNGEI